MPPVVATKSRVERGEPVVEGIAIGRAIVWANDPPPRQVAGSTRDERARLGRALVRAKASVEELVRLLPPAEAELFEPEIAILAELAPELLGRVDARTTAEDAVTKSTSLLPADLLVDVRARLLDGLAHDERSVALLLEGREGERVLVTGNLTPSVVASLPARVVGIVAGSEHTARAGCGYTSHAAILARGRDIPLAFVLPSAIRDIADDDELVVDTTVNPAVITIAPDDATNSDAHRRREVWTRARSEEQAHVSAPLTHLGVEVHVNVGSIYEPVPASAEGVGLVRTELVFSEHAHAPTEAEQFGALRVIAKRAGDVPIVVRLFDIGGDKIVPWLPLPATGAEEMRGVALLLRHPGILDVQLRAIVRAADHADLRLLLPLVGCAAEVEELRSRTRGQLAVGAMIESAEGIEQLDSIVAAADFICIGTNDLSASVTGQPREADSTLNVDGRILRMIARIIERSHARGRKVSVCGELAGDPHCARILVGLGIDALSVSTTRFAKVKHSLSSLSRDDCHGVAREALR